MPEDKLYLVACDDDEVYVLSNQGFGDAIEKAYSSGLLDFHTKHKEITITLIAQDQEIIK